MGKTLASEVCEALGIDVDRHLMALDIHLDGRGNELRLTYRTVARDEPAGFVETCEEYVLVPKDRLPE